MHPENFSVHPEDLWLIRPTFQTWTENVCQGDDRGGCGVGRKMKTSSDKESSSPKLHCLLHFFLSFGME